MSAPSTNAEWAKLIAEIEKEVDSRIRNAATSLVTLPQDSHALAQLIDHTLLKLDATESQIDALCKEAAHHDFKTVCIRPNYITHALSTFRNLPSAGSTGVCTVIGFHDPSASSLADKRTEALAALDDGALELDFVINYPLLLETEPAYSKVYTELASLLQAVTGSGVACVTKLILETSQLTTPLIVAGCVLAWYAGFDFVKTSTGFNGRGASVGDVRVMRAVGDVLEQRSEAGRSKRMRVKASGGVRTWDGASTMIQAGAERLGVSAGLAIIQGFTAGHVAEADAPQGTSGDGGY